MWPEEGIDSTLKRIVLVLVIEIRRWIGDQDDYSDDMVDIGMLNPQR